MKRYLIVGDGVAGARAAMKIKEADHIKDLKDTILKEGYDFKKLR